MNTHKTPLLQYDKVYAAYGPIQALENVSLEVCENEIVTLIGANGAGKSTLMMSLFGQPKIKKGEIKVSGHPVHNLPTHEVTKLNIAISPEGRRIFSKLSCEDNLLMGCYHIKDPKKIANNLERNYSLFPILKARRGQRAGTLSGGEQQMLAIGRSLMCDPKLFLLDEPSLGLAPQIVSQIFTILKDIAKQGTTIFLVEQNAKHALKLADRGYVLVNGKITISGTSKELLSDPNVQAAYLGA